MVQGCRVPDKLFLDRKGLKLYRVIQKGRSVFRHVITFLRKSSYDNEIQYLLRWINIQQIPRFSSEKRLPFARSRVIFLGGKWRAKNTFARLIKMIRKIGGGYRYDSNFRYPRVNSNDVATLTIYGEQVLVAAKDIFTKPVAKTREYIHCFSNRKAKSNCI